MFQIKPFRGNGAKARIRNGKQIFKKSNLVGVPPTTKMKWCKSENNKWEANFPLHQNCAGLYLNVWK